MGLGAVPPPVGRQSLSGPPAFFGYLYLLRVPLLVAAILVGFPFFAMVDGSPGRSLFENLFVLESVPEAVTTVASIVLAWSLLLTGRLVLLNGDERFGLVQWLRQNQLSAVSVFIAGLLAAPSIAASFFLDKSFRPDKLLAVGIGVVIAYFIAVIGLLAAVFISPQGTQSASNSFPAPGFIRTLFQAANNNSIFRRERWRDIGTWIADHLPEGLKAGYLDLRPEFVNNGVATPNTGYGLPWSGHWLAWTFALATFVLYYAIDFYKKAHLDDSTPIPALAFVLLLLLNVNWIFANLAFFLDRFRIPLLVPVVILSIAGTYARSSDHYYEVQARTNYLRIEPQDVLKNRAPADHQGGKPIIVVAAAGGGIQAAAWTAQVLTGLQAQSLTWQGTRFSDSVALISSISGGAAGAMFFLNEYGQSPEPPGFQLPNSGHNFAELVERASESSLDDIAWGLVYRDLPRILAPYGTSGTDRLLDRGGMLERTWRNRGRDGQKIYATLSDWRQGVLDGWRPATIFNSTITETGEPLLLATTDLNRQSTASPDPKQRQPRRMSFYDLFPNSDLPVVTAVRLAASFPFVSPATRPLGIEPGYHAVDGGYYDNYGVATVVEWIDEAYDARKRANLPLPPILVVQIRSFPDDAIAPPKQGGWFYQTHAPFDGLLHARTSAQLVRDRDELLLLRERWGKGAESVPLIRFAGFQFKASNAPLSWKMNTDQTAAISTEWNKILKPDNLDLLQVRCMLGARAGGIDCVDLARRKDPW